LVAYLLAVTRFFSSPAFGRRTTTELPIALESAGLEILRSIGVGGAESFLVSNRGTVATLVDQDDERLLNSAACLPVNSNTRLMREARAQSDACERPAFTAF
jgi:hypothetical protein